MPSHDPLTVRTSRLLSPQKLAAIPVFSAMLLAGCGQTGAPLAPSLKLPNQVTDLTVRRIADHVILKWTMPRRTTDKLVLKGDQTVQICRRIESAACLTVGSSSFPPEKPASYEDALPSDLVSGSPRLLAYSIQVLGPHGRSAGASNIAYTLTGPPPPAFVHPHAEMTAGGVLLQWQPAPATEGEQNIEMERTLLSIPSQTKVDPRQKSPLTASPSLLKEQSLVVPLPAGGDPGHALDRDAAFDQRYSYRISRVTTATIEGKSIAVEGAISPEILVDTRDTFPPAVPSGLAAVSSPDEGAIDLSWTSNTEPDLAGYAVYRSEAGGQARRISPSTLTAPAFRDPAAQPGRTYAYSVTALDRDGNQSARSAEATESLPAKP